MSVFPINPRRFADDFSIVSSFYFLRKTVAFKNAHSKGAANSSAPITFICSKERATVSKTAIPTGFQTAKHITASDTQTAAISLILLKNEIRNKDLVSDLHSKT